jgi:hypothetical protein
MYAYIIDKRSLYVWLLLNVLDLGLTLAILQVGGGELMPAAVWLLQFGPWGFVAGKIVATIIAAAVLSRMRQRVWTVCNAGMLVVVCWNVISLTLSVWSVI